MTSASREPILRSLLGGPFPTHPQFPHLISRRNISLPLSDCLDPLCNLLSLGDFPPTSSDRNLLRDRDILTFSSKEQFVRFPLETVTKVCDFIILGSQLLI
ncbi:hypothetical protein CEXT_186651 [Caerostris extrusa]|uniref:Uncharacterized protein n=1 Tax=Caerostris extrusa TaxID=172846 RepID=A0AAV4XQG7_CAEEX|nr:hypothetical protein CEXT_186651 [Caerostris extrusa]